MDRISPQASRLAGDAAASLTGSFQARPKSLPATLQLQKNGKQNSDITSKLKFVAGRSPLTTGITTTVKTSTTSNFVSKASALETTASGTLASGLQSACQRRTIQNGQLTQAEVEQAMSTFVSQANGLLNGHGYTLLSKADAATADEFAVTDEIDHSNINQAWRCFVRTRSNEVRWKLFAFYESEYKKAAGAQVKRLPYRPLVEPCDVFQDAAAGLLEAIDSYDPDRNDNFEVWAGYRVRGSVMDGLRVLQTVPRRIAKARRDLRVRIQALYHKLGTEPNADQFCEEYGEEFRAIISNPLFHSEVYNQMLDDSTTHFSVSEDACSFENYYLTVNSDVDAVESKLDRLELIDLCEEVLSVQAVDGDKMADVIFGYYFFSTNLNGLAKKHKISISSVTKLMESALAILRSYPDLREDYHINFTE